MPLWKLNGERERGKGEKRRSFTFITQLERVWVRLNERESNLVSGWVRKVLNLCNNSVWRKRWHAYVLFWAKFDWIMAYRLHVSLCNQCSNEMEWDHNLEKKTLSLCPIIIWKRKASEKSRAFSRVLYVVFVFYHRNQQQQRR